MEGISIRKQWELKFFNTYTKAQTRLHTLSYLFWECTVRCNINCLHCGSDCHKEPGRKDMPLKDFLAVTKVVAEKYNPNKIMIVITGGEPLVRHDLEEAGKALYRQGFPWGFVTNGIALTKIRLHNLIQAGLRSVTVSLDGLEEHHNWLRGTKHGFNKATEAIKMIAEENRLVFDVVTCVNRRNLCDLSKLKALLVDLKVVKWRIFTIDPIGRAKDNPELILSSHQLKMLMEFIKTTRKEGDISVSYGCEGFLGNYEKEVRDGYFFCRAGINIASVLSDGSIAACPNNSRYVIQGNIYSDNFIDVWENRYQLMRDKSWAKKGICSRCKAFKWCKGNGLHLWDFEKEEVMMCHYKLLK